MKPLQSFGDSCLMVPDVAHPDRHFDAVGVGGCVVVGASAAGWSHRRAGRPRDDAFSILSDGDWLVAAVADGLGSKSHSRHGAAFSVNLIANHVLMLLQQQPAGPSGEGTGAMDAVEAAIRAAYGKVLAGMPDFSARLGVPVDALACTLLLMILDVRSGFLCAARVGDGAILALDPNGDVFELVDAPEGSQPQETYSLLDGNGRDCLGVRVWPNPPQWQTLFLMTDGISHDLLFTDHQDAVRTWAHGVSTQIRSAENPYVAAEGMVNWLATYELPGSWDDRTMVVVTRKEDHST